VVGIQDSSEAAENVEQIIGIALNWSERLRHESEARAALGELIKQVQLTQTGLRVTINLPVVAVDAGPSDDISLSHFVPMTMRRRGVELRLILDGRANEQRHRSTWPCSKLWGGHAPDSRTLLPAGPVRWLRFRAAKDSGSATSRV
jgi:hypothetical protein